MFSRSRAGGRDLDDGAVERPGLPLDTHELFALQMREDPGEHPRFATSGAAGGRGGARCQSGPVTRALRGDRPEGGEHGVRGETDRAARHRERGRAPGVVSLREVHTARRPESCMIIHMSVNRP